MNPFVAITYIFSGSICLVVAVVLLTVKQGDNLKNNYPYQNIKRLIAYSAFLDVIVDILVMLCVFYNVDFHLLDYFVIPIIYFLQLAMMISSLLKLIHSHLKTKRFIYISASAVGTMALAYIIAYIVFSLQNNLSLLSMATYQHFSETTTALTINIIGDAIIFIAVAISAVSLIIETKRFDQHLVNAHSGSSVINGRKLERLIYIFIGYFMFAAIDFLLADDYANIFFVFSNTVLFVVFSITVLNLYQVYVKTEPAETSEADAVKEEAVGSEAILAIEEKLKNWRASRDKPFLTEGLTLDAVADMLKIKSRLLSGYLNDILKTNFCGWINMMRVEEAKRIIAEKPGLSMADVAFKAGFADASSLSRSFKRATGESPTEYRKKVYPTRENVAG